MGSDTPQDFVLQGIRPRMILFCTVSDPAGELNPHRFRRKSFESFPFSLKGHFSLSRGVWYPVKQLLFSINSQELNQNSKMFQGMNQGPTLVRFMKKNQRPKISCYCREERLRKRIKDERIKGAELRGEWKSVSRKRTQCQRLKDERRRGLQCTYNIKEAR